MPKIIKNKAETSKIKKEKAVLKENTEDFAKDSDFTQDIEQVISFFTKEQKEEIIKKETKKSSISRIGNGWHFSRSICC